MNKKHLILMWGGILAIVFVAFTEIIEPYRPNYGNFGAWVLSIVLITSGFIVTLKDKKDQKTTKRIRAFSPRGWLAGVSVSLTGPAY